MDTEKLFASYYIRYRGDVVIPAVSDPEYTIFLSYANEALNAWATTPDVLWNELWNTLQLADDGDKTFTPGTTTYAAPSDMQRAGGYVRLTGINGTVVGTIPQIPVVEPAQAQIMADTSTYAFFTGNPQDGFTCNIYGGSIDPTQQYAIDYPYYMQYSPLVNPSDTPQLSDTEFIINWCLAQRFLNSNNTTKYQIMNNMATQDLSDMINVQTSGTNFNQWRMNDPRGSGFGSRGSRIGSIRL